MFSASYDKKVNGRTWYCFCSSAKSVLFFPVFNPILTFRSLVGHHWNKGQNKELGNESRCRDRTTELFPKPLVAPQFPGPLKTGKRPSFEGDRSKSKISGRTVTDRTASIYKGPRDEQRVLDVRVGAATEGGLLVTSSSSLGPSKWPKGPF